MATISERKNKEGKIRYTAQIRVRRNGITHTEAQTFSSRKAAERWAAVREHELSQPGALRMAKAASYTLGDLIQRYIDEFVAGGRFGRSKQFDLQKLLKTDIAAVGLDTLQTSDLVQHIRRRLEEGVKPQTANNDLVWIRVVLKTARPAWGVQVDLQMVDDAAELCRKHGLIGRPEHRDKRPSLDELDRLLKLFSERDNRAQIPMVDLVLFALFSARRQEEITRLLWADYDRDRKQIVVRDAKDPRKKKGNNLLVALTDEAIAIIDRQPRTNERIFPYNPKSIGAAFTRACHVLEIDDLVFHSLRHECASWLFERHWPIPQVALVTGHKSWSTLQRYTHLRGTEPHDRYEGWSWRPQPDASIS